ncbi:MAG TPA: hypothetical protein VHW60_11800 [Caulobacteraceae bacterium]|nr:hypothetical protein [Caulobacteraceae bacterium]
MRWGPLVTAAALTLAACGPPPGPVANAPAAAPTNAPPANMTATPASPSLAATNAATAVPAGPNFKITVTLTGAAAAQIASLNQDVIVSADFYGQANPSGKRMADDMDQISLANEVRITLPGAGGAATVVVPALDQSKFAYIIGGDPQMLINVFSGEGLNPDNKIDCSLFEDRLALAEQQGVQIKCKLIGES